MAKNTSSQNGLVIDGIIDGMELESAVQIDICNIDKNAVADAEAYIKYITELYYDKTWIKKHPEVKRRLDIELENLRNLIKMRRSDEQAHDALLNGISSNNTNASLYRALAEIQRASLAVTKQIAETIEKLDNILKGYQLELPVGVDAVDDDSPPTQEENQQMYRGSRAFIMQQIEKSEEQ
jgi:hypothetical protein